MDERLKSRRGSVICSPPSARSSTFSSIATGTALRTREKARLELLKASDHEKAANHVPLDESSTGMDANSHDRLNFSSDTGGGDEEVAPRNMLEHSSMYVDEDELRELRRRPPVAFEVRNAATKEGELQVAVGTTETTISRPKRAPEARDQLSDQAFVKKLREKNKELLDRLVQRFATLRRVSDEGQEGHEYTFGSPKSRTDNNAPATKLSGFEDAILFFLHVKHKHDVLYFKRKTARGGKNAEHTKLSLGLSSAPASTGKYMPYDLERIDEMPRSGAGDYFMMTSSSLVHHTNNNDNDVSGEKFLVRKTFMGWVRAIRMTIYRDNCKRVAQCLPFARHSFVRSILQSSRTLRDIQKIRSLTLPTTRPAVGLVTVQEHQKEHLAMAEMSLIDAKEKLLSLMEETVQKIYDELNPPTNLDSAEAAASVRSKKTNAKWKSVPIAAMRQRKAALRRQKDAATHDISLLETYIRVMDYMFTESLYLMLIGCIRHLRDQLSAEESLGTLCAAVTIVGDSLDLTPSFEQTKHIFLDGITRLTRLVSNFHFTKNAATWSNNRGTGLLAVVVESFESSDLFSSEFDLQSVVRKDPKIDRVTKELVSELALWFDRAAQQMLAFESLRVISVEVQSAQMQRGDDQTAGYVQPFLTRLIGVSGGELSRFLKSISHRLNVLDRSQHACQKVQSSWKVGFLEIQCRDSIAKILELISQERNSLLGKLHALASEGVAECVSALQRATVLLEDRPQLIEFFCEQMKQVRLLKEGEKQLNQNIRNVDETVRALKRFAPSLGSDVSPQHNVMHQFVSKYTALTQSHAKFAAKVLPNITYQVNSALQKYSSRCQNLLKMYDEFSTMEEQEDMEKNVGGFQEAIRELSGIEKATKLYQEYQKMVGLKVVEIPSLAEAMAKWGEVRELVNFTLQWLAAIDSMENGIFSEQNWESHADKVHSFLPIIRELQSRERAGFATKLLVNTHQAVIDYLRKLSLVKEMAQPWVKIHHWKEILKLMNILNYVSSIGVLLTDGYTATLGFLRSRDLWRYELQIREITQKAQHDAVTEKKLNEMKCRLEDAVLPIIRVLDSYELDLPRAIHLLGSFEDDLLTIQSLAQVTASSSLQLQLVQWRDEARHCEEVLDRWIAIQRSRTKLSLLFSLRDVQQSVTDASFEFQAIDRKWRGMMHSAKGTASLSICLREVVTIGFLVGAQASHAKLWLQLGTYLDEKRKYFPRFSFLSDHDLFQLIIYARDPQHLARMVSKCFRGIDSLRLRRTTIDLPVVNSSASLGSGSNIEISEEKTKDDVPVSNLQAGVDIDAIYGTAVGEELPIKALRVSASPQFWLKELDERVRVAMIEAVHGAMNGSIVSLFEDNLESLVKPRSSALKKRLEPRADTGRSGNKLLYTTESDAQITAVDGRAWQDYPLQVVILCVHILVTHELTPLVRLDRSGGAWQRFWQQFQQKKSNLSEHIARRTSSPRELWVASSILTQLLNKSQEIRELYEDQPVAIVGQSVEAAADQTESDVSTHHFNCATGDSFSWTKLPRYHYDPFEQKCIIHHSQKTYQYEYSFIGSYTCPVLSPLCNRTVLAMSSALSLEHGLLVHSSSSGGGTRKRTLVRDLAAMAGRECIEFDYSNGLTLTHFKRILRGALQSNSMWLLFSGVEVSSALKVFAHEMNQIVDALRARQSSLVLDGSPVDITNNELAVVVTCSLDYQLSHHQQVLVHLSSCFAPVSCPSVHSEFIVEALLLANGLKDWKQLSERLEALFCLLMDDSAPYIKDLSLHKLTLAFAIVRNATLRLDTNPWQAAEKSLVAALWDEIHSRVLPERRLAFLKCIRTVFPHAVDLEINAFGMLALRTPTRNSATVSSDLWENSAADEDAALPSSESDEEDGNHELKLVKLRIETAISSRRLSASEFYVRKLLELHQIVSKKVFVVVVGRGICGKSTAINVLSSVFAGKVSSSESALFGDPDRKLRTVRVYTEAFNLKDVYGEATGDSTWEDGFFIHFFRQNCVDVSIDNVDTLETGGDPALSPRPMRRKSLFVPEDTAAKCSLAPASWIVFDGVRDAPTLLEPLRGLLKTSPKETKKMTLPNGDQLECTHEKLRIFCEVESLEHWSPTCLSRCGLVYMQTEHMVPYTVLIKSWLQQQQPKRNRSSLAHLTRFLEPTSEFVVKLMRTHLPSILGVFKRYFPSFLECSVTHGVANMLQVLTPFVAEIAKGVVEDDAEWMADAGVAVAYAATISLGAILPRRARMEFHLAATKIAPHLQKEHPIFTFDCSATLFDVGLRFQDHRAVLFLWRTSLLESGKPTTRRSSFAYQSEFPRRTSAVLKARGRIVTSQDTEDSDGDDEIVGDTSAITSPLSVIYVPTAATVSCSAWLKMIGLAKANAFVVGESGVGKTLVMENCLRQLGQKERVSATAVQVNYTTTGFDIQRAIESGMTGKLKGAHCPGVGKRSLVLLLENVNLDTQGSSMQVNGPCSAMIRQVLDGKGSFIKSTKEYVEFRDLAVWCSFSLSKLGYPGVPTRLLRHFHLMWLPDQTDHIFAQVAPMFTSYFRRRYESSFGELTSVVYRLQQFPIQMFKRGRKLWKPSAVTPHLLFSVGSVLSVFLSIMNASLSRVPADPATEFELLTLYLTLQLHRNRFLEQENRNELQAAAFRIAKKLGFSSQSLAFLRSPEEFFFADCGDTDGITRINAKTLAAFFVAGEERFHWNRKTSLKAECCASGPESGDLSPRKSRSKGIRPDNHFPTPGIVPKSPNIVNDKAVVRRSSLTNLALKSGLPGEKVATCLSFYQLQNTLDVYSFLQSGARHLLLSGSDTADRRSTTMVACGTLSFRLREISAELQISVFIEHVKSIVLDAGLKATQTVLYVEYEDLDAEEVALLVYLIRQDDLPSHVYSSADKVKLHALGHQPKGRPTCPPANRASFLRGVTSEKEKLNVGSKKSAQSPAHLQTIFRENVRRSLYVVLSVGCKRKLLEFMTQQPCVYYRFVSKTFPPWQDASAKEICNNALQEWELLCEESEISISNLRDMVLTIHQTAENFKDDGFDQRLPSMASRARRFGAVATRLDEMLRVFKILFAFHYKKLDKQRQDLRKVLSFLTKRLTQTNVRVAKEETSEIAQSDASQAVVDFAAQLSAQESVEKEARRLFLLDEERCAKIQGEIEMKRANIQRELSKTLPDVQEATEALSQINKYHIVEMKSFTNPPQLVRLAMQAVCVLLDVPPTWSEALRILADIRFLDRLRNFDKDRIDPSLMDRVRFYVNHPDFSMENMRRASLASTTLCKWVLALVRYFEAMKRVASTQQLLEEIEQSYHVVVQRAEAEKRKLVDIEIHLSELRVLHAVKTQREAELQRTQETRQRFKSSVTSFGQVIKRWHDVTKERLESVEKRRENLLLDCVFVATLITFGAEKSHGNRDKLVSQCQEAIRANLSSYAMAVGIPTMILELSGEGLASPLQKSLGDMMGEEEEDEAFATSLFLMDQIQQVCFKIPFLVDPLDRGASWIKQAYSNSTPSKGSSSFAGYIVVDASDPLFLRAIKTCVAQGPPSMVLVKNASEGDEAIVEAALELIVLLKKKGTCAVYFAAKSLDKAATWLPKTWSHFAVVDFTQDPDNSSESVHNEIESLKSKLSIEKAKEEILFTSFLTNICAASDEAAQASTAGLNSTSISILSAWISSGSGHHGFYNEDSIERISAQLDDYMAVRHARMQLQQDLKSARALQV
ncbi:Microtubule-binding stalk of dynein motor domain-containing protein [Phytophthora infestans]|uniref:Microtubule-binding stalk of dynein motor domain-containing protein n=1 Tax=Phytophthora infestans TaxID=4787 RepID=A0A833WD52_PHYIN|nr:Microtubule-binding stalk of dynein motor domain-containing protein [Phytophthora infestans]